MSRYNDINQLLEEMGASDRSADDPWTISRSSRQIVTSGVFSPGVEADIGAPAQDLTTEMQSAEQIAKADEVVTNPAASTPSTKNSSSGGGILGGLLNLFPLASAVGKLFGLGGSSSPSPLTPYIAPPSVNFEGAMSPSVSNSTAASLPGSSYPSASEEGGIGSLSYGSNDLPRAAQVTPAAQVSSLTSSPFISQPAPDSQIAGSELAAITSPPGGAQTSAGMPSTGNDQTGSSSSPQGQSILVQVQAMDSQSFMDHSNDIAQAVRHAMLNMHSVNDVIAEL